MGNELAVTTYSEAVLEIIKILNLDHTRINSLRIEFDLDEFVMVQARFYIQEDDLLKIATELRKYEIVDKTDEAEQLAEDTCKRGAAKEGGELWG